MITFILRIAVAVVCAFWLGFALGTSERNTSAWAPVVVYTSVGVALLLALHGLGVL